MTTDHIADGIHFNMPEDEYHAAPRMSGSGVADMDVSPATFWARSWMNPEQEDDDTPARILGRAYHTARLEPDQLDKRFVPELDKAAYEITNGTQIGEALAERGEPKKKAGEDVLAQAQRLAAAGYDKPLYHIDLDRWEAERKDRTPIPPKFWHDIQRDVKLIRETPHIANHLEGGFAEVSVFWTDERTGQRMKCRLDYLKATEWSDFKTFDNSRRNRLFNRLVQSFMYDRYYLKAAFQMRAVEAIRTTGLPIIDGSKAQTDLIRAIQARPDPLDCFYIWQEKNGVPNLLSRRIRFFTEPHPSHAHNEAGADEATATEVGKKTVREAAWFLKANYEIDHHLNLFAYYREIYGDAPWKPVDPAGEINDDSFPAYWLEQV